MLKYIGIGLIVALCGCGGAMPSAQSSVQARASARAAVSLALDVFKATDQVCQDVYEEAQDKNVAKKCYAVLMPASEAMHAAANAVDSWSDVDQKNWPCLAADVEDSLMQVKALLPSLGLKEVPDMVTDALLVVKSSTPACNRGSK